MQNFFSNNLQDKIHDSLINLFGISYTKSTWQPLQGGGVECHVYGNIINEKHSIVVRLLGANKEQEAKCAQRAFFLDIGPNLLDCNINSGFMILEKSPGSPLTQENLNKTETLIAIASQLRIWQDANSNIKPNISIQDKILQLLTHINQDHLSMLGLTNIENKLAQCNSRINHTTLKPCHGDPNPSNILLLPSNNIHLIDWSHAGLNNPWADYAMVMQYLLPNTTKAWLKIISNYDQDMQLASLNAYDILCKIHCAIWSLSQAQNICNKQNANLAEKTKLFLSKQYNLSLSQLQKKWLDGNFDNDNIDGYLLLTQLVAKKVNSYA